MDLFPDFKDLLAAFAASGVRYVLVGGAAVRALEVDAGKGSEEIHAQRALDEVPVRVLSLPDLIANKRASGRARDLEDAAELELIAARLPR